MISVGIIGATGYAGAELLRFLLAHPKVNALALSSASFEGQAFSAVYPGFSSLADSVLEDPEAVIAASDVVFSALPHGVGESFAELTLKAGKVFIDISADFRFGEDEETFKDWYGKNWDVPSLHDKAVYGLPELNREQTVGCKLVSNPGCYPTAASLGLFPALRKGLVGPGTVIVDAYSGVTGAGRNPSQTTHFSDCADSIAAYKVGAHRHTPEIARNMQQMAGRPVPLVFTPHLAPINRGILATIYAPLAEAVADTSFIRLGNAAVKEKTQAIQALYEEFYKDEPFVRVMPSGVEAATRNVRGSNYCDISVHLDQSGSLLIITSAIDNMVKGAAGQAIQNMNIVMGYPETAGLNIVPAMF